MDKIIKSWKTKDMLSRCAYSLVALLFFIIPFGGFVLESFNINIISVEMVFGIYILSIICSILAKQWKLVFIATIGGIIIYSITIGILQML